MWPRQEARVAAQLHPAARWLWGAAAAAAAARVGSQATTAPGTARSASVACEVPTLRCAATRFLALEVHGLLPTSPGRAVTTTAGRAVGKGMGKKMTAGQKALVDALPANLCATRKETAANVGQ